MLVSPLTKMNVFESWRGIRPRKAAALPPATGVRPLVRGEGMKGIACDTFSKDRGLNIQVTGSSL